MKILSKIFHRNKPTPPPQEAKEERLSIEGIAPAPMTPEPDEAEIAAQAVLELMDQVQSNENLEPGTLNLEPAKRLEPAEPSVARYQQLAQRMRQAREQQQQRALRFISWCEEQLKKHDLPVQGDGSLSLIETELYKRIDVVEREKGDLKRRWQHCLAEVTVRLMNNYDIKL